MVVYEGLFQGKILKRLNGRYHRRYCGVAAGYCLWNCIGGKSGKRPDYSDHWGFYCFVSGRFYRSDRRSYRCFYCYRLRDCTDLWYRRTGCGYTYGRDTSFVDGNIQTGECDPFYSLSYCGRFYQWYCRNHFFYTDKGFVWNANRKCAGRFYFQMGCLCHSYRNHFNSFSGGWVGKPCYYNFYSAFYQENSRFFGCYCVDDACGVSLQAFYR